MSKEEIMMRHSFNRPVGVLVGLGLPVEVGTVMEAYRLLEDWPPSQRNPTHSVAMKACKAALLDLIDAETARAAFAAFAQKRHSGRTRGAVAASQQCCKTDSADESARPLS